MLKLLPCFFLVLSAACAQTPPAGEMPPQAVILTKIQEGSLQNKMMGVGTFTPYNDVTLKAEIPGCVEKSYVKEGQSVKEGQKLFSLRAHESLAKIKKAEAAVKLSHNSLERRKKLKEKEFISMQDVEKAEAELQTAEADLILAKEDFNKTQICAPFSGVLSMKKVSKGAYVSPNQDLIRIQDVDPIHLVFQLPQKDIALMAVGDPVVAKTDAYPDKTFPGTIEAIDPSVNETNRSVSVYATFSNPHYLLIPGLYAHLYPAASPSLKKTPVIPEQALVVQESGPHVYKKVKDKAILTKITLGLRTADQAEVVSGLQVGDEIVLEGQEKLFNGSPIVGSYNVHH
jgi:membrane fusion protein (multidrug efflux system)